MRLEGFIITYLLAAADLAVRFYPRPIDLVRMFTLEVTGRASICIRPWARFFPPLIGLSMSAPCLFALITLCFIFLFFFFIPETVLRRVQPELRMERRRDKRREGVRVEKVQLGNFTVLIILKILLNSRSYFLSCTASPLLMLQCFIRAESPGR